MEKNTKHYTIGEVSAICGMNAKTLRYYDKINLVVPDVKDCDNGYRYYTKRQIYQIFAIKRLRSLGLSLKELKTLLVNANLETYEEILAGLIKNLNKEKEITNRKLTESMYLMERLKRGQNLIKTADSSDDITIDGIVEEEDIKIEEITQVEVIHTKGIQTNFKTVNISTQRWFEIYDLAHRRNMITKGSVLHTYYNNPLEQFFKIECEIGVSIPVINRGHSETGKFGGFKAATILHLGRYDKIINSHLKAIRWINAHGYVIDGPISEEYIISPMDLPDEDAFLTKIIIPIKL